jgi:hypothetical protein
VASTEPTDVPAPAEAEDIGRVVALTDGVIARRAT